MRTELEINGRQYVLANDEWLLPAHNVTVKACDEAARKLGLSDTGKEVVQRIVDFVRSMGGRPVASTEVIQHFAAESWGATGGEWTKLFKYTCKQRAMLRYRSLPPTSSSLLYFAFEDTLPDRASFTDPDR
ncbi:MAG: hypothetical protein IPL61_10610 [Myxococcales bacterium]|nr:hypothetical protein [Myxococcales bacterium]